MLSSKQRAMLRGLGNKEETILQVGKDGVTENVVRQAADALEARELIKGRILENSGLTAREACDVLCEKTGAEGVQVIGSRFLLYKPSQKPKIKL